MLSSGLFVLEFIEIVKFVERRPCMSFILEGRKALIDEKGMNH